MTFAILSIRLGLTRVGGGWGLPSTPCLI